MSSQLSEPESAPGAANHAAIAGEESLAIVGIGCRFPGGADTPEKFWRLLWDGHDATSEVPPERWLLDSYYSAEQDRAGRLSSPRGGFIPSIDRFDPLFFGISPREAAAIDPQQRLLLELAWEALEDGGLVVDQLAGSRTGVFVGLSAYDYGIIQHQATERKPINRYLMLGTTLSIAANRISYAFDLRGPSLVVDTACSSSLVALHLACRSIWLGESNLALVGGANLIIQPTISVSFSNAGMLSPDGRCKSFDASANGYVRGEGGGVIVLKRLSQALRDSDRIYALILGTAVNQDGHTPGISVPNGKAQEALLRAAYWQANVSPVDVQYVEAHGTGTAVGDPIEANALGSVLGNGRPSEAVCWIGSVKTNIGHLEAGAGIAGVIKTALALHHRQIPRNLHFETPNPEINFERLQLKVPVRSQPWPANGQLPRLAGVNSFGFGGTNAHAALSEFRNAARQSVAEPEVGRPCLLPLSARSPAALLAQADACAQWLVDHPDICLADMVYTAAVRRSHHLHRVAVVADSRQQFIDRLQAVGSEHPRRGVSTGRAHPACGIVFVFTGMGSQWWAMGRQLLEVEPVFRGMIACCDRLLRYHADWSLLDELTADEDQSQIDDPRISQPALFAIQVALAALWRSWGIEPTAIVGHSVGEIAAAHVAGALSLSDAVQVIFHRSRLQQRTRGLGKMLAVGCSAEEAECLLRDGLEDSLEPLVTVAAINSPGAVTLSGDADALQGIAVRLESQGIYCRFLKVDVPYHSPAMNALGEELVASLQAIEPQQPTVPLFSTVTGERVRGLELGADYWWQNVRQSVLFEDAVTTLLEAGESVFLEVGPHPVLAAAIHECATAVQRPATVLASLRRREPERPGMLQTLGALFVHGFPVKWENVNPPGQLVSLPPYAWQRERFWRESDESRLVRTGSVRTLGPGLLGRDEHPVLGRSVHSAAGSDTHTWQVDLDLQVDHAWIADHCIEGAVIYPAAAYIQAAFAAARLQGTSRALESVEIHRPLVLAADRKQPLQLVIEDDVDGFTFYSQETNSTWTRLATGKVSHYRAAVPPVLPIAELRERCPQELNGEEWYRQMRDASYQYGPGFQGLRRIWCGGGEAFAEIGLSKSVVASLDDDHFHPALIDSCLQLCQGALPFAGEGKLDTGTYVPKQAERIHSYPPSAAEINGQNDFQGGDSPGPWYCHARTRRAAETEGDLYDLSLCDHSGHVRLEILGLQTVRIGARPTADSMSVEDCLYEHRWLLQPRDGQFVDGMPTPARLLEEVQPEMTRLGLFAGQRNFQGEAKPRLDALCAAYITHAFDNLGWRFLPGQRLTTDAIADALGVVSEQRRYFASLLEIVAEEGIIQRSSDSWEICQVLDPQQPAEAWRTALRDCPSLLAELTLLGRCGTNLEQILRGRVDPADLLGPRGTPTALLEQLEHSSPSVLFLHRSVQAAMAALVRRLPAERPLRVLELGASGLSSLVLPLLPRERTTYVLSDTSPQTLAQARLRLQAFSFVQYRQLDISQEFHFGEFEPHSFDVILAANAVRPGSQVRETLGRMRQLLAPGGLLLQVEHSCTNRLRTLVFGGIAGDDQAPEQSVLPAAPAYSLPQWRDLLAEAGFIESACCCESDEAEPAAAILLVRGPSYDVDLEEQSPAAIPRSLSASIAFGEPRFESSGCWIILADQGGAAAALSALLTNRGGRVVVVQRGDRFEHLDDDLFQVRPAQPEDMHRLLRELLDDGIRARGIVHLWSFDSQLALETPCDWPDQAHELGCLSALHLVQACAAAGWTERPRLYLVTRGAQPVVGGELPLVGQSTLWGLGRVVRSEHPELRCTLVDLGAANSSAGCRALFDELLGDDVEDEIALRGTDRYIRRLIPVRPAELLAPQATRQPANRAFRLALETAGQPDSLRARGFSRRSPGPHEVEIEVRAAALNFKDVAKAFNLLSGESLRGTWSGGRLGMECAGVVLACGTAVENFQTGDEVVALVAGSLASHVIADGRLVARKPDNLTFEAAVTVPVAFMTAAHALHNLAGLEPGERILIHAAAGGVGLAALQLARLAGAEVFATAGGPEKRDFLRLLGVEHVLDSRSLEFAQQIVERTNGRGVDVVLNSLAGPAMARSLALLSTGGRFLELGKRDIDQNARLALQPFQKNIAFFAIDLDRLWAARPERIFTSFAEIMQRLHDRVIGPLPYRVFPASQAQDAFRSMARGRHVGKVVLTMQDPALAVVDECEPTIGKKSINPGHDSIIRDDASYLITGGLGGFGLATARWLVEHGARYLALVGRSGASTAEARETIKELEQAGARIMVARADVAQIDDVRRVLSELRGSMPPLRGVFHAAMVVDDGLLVELNRDRFEAVMAPKVAGALNLHRLTADDPLDCFVLFSSTSALFGTVGLGNYAAANTFLDCLAHYRRARGLPGLSVNWTAVSDVGYLAQREDVRSYVEQLGFVPLPSRFLLQALDVLLRHKAVQTAVLQLDWSQRGPYTLTAISPRFSRLIPQQSSDMADPATADGEGRSLRELLRSTAGAARQELLTTRLRNQAGKALGIVPESLDADLPLTNMGLESLIAIDLCNRVRKEFGVELTILKLMGGVTLNNLLHEIEEQLVSSEGSSFGEDLPSHLHI